MLDANEHDFTYHCWSCPSPPPTGAKGTDDRGSQPLHPPELQASVTLAKGAKIVLSSGQGCRRFLTPLAVPIHPGFHGHPRNRHSVSTFCMQVLGPGAGHELH